MGPATRTREKADRVVVVATAAAAAAEAT